jgi:hypothetical protein
MTESRQLFDDLDARIQRLSAPATAGNPAGRRAAA